MNLFDKESPIYIRVAYGHHNNRICDNLSDKENISCLYLFKLESRCMAGLRVTTSVSMRHQVTGGGALSSLAQAIPYFFCILLSGFGTPIMYKWRSLRVARSLLKTVWESQHNF